MPWGLQEFGYITIHDAKSHHQAIDPPKSRQTQAEAVAGQRGGIFSRIYDVLVNMVSGSIKTGFSISQWANSITNAREIKAA